MKKKIVGILVCTLVIAAAVLPVAGIMTISNTKKIEKSVSSDAAIEQNIEDSQEINEPNDNTPQPAATKTGYLSIPAAAFIPQTNSYSYVNIGSEISGPSSLSLVAPVQLLHEATVTKLTFYWKDDDVIDNGYTYLYRNNMDGTKVVMAITQSSGGGGVGSSYDDTIAYADIDNSLYSYYLTLDLLSFSGNVWGYGVIIEYDYETKGRSQNMDISQQTQVAQEILSR